MADKVKFNYVDENGIITTMKYNSEGKHIGYINEYGHNIDYSNVRT